MTRWHALKQSVVHVGFMAYVGSTFNNAYFEMTGFWQQFGMMADEGEVVLSQAAVMYPDGLKMGH